MILRHERFHDARPNQHYRRAARDGQQIVRHGAQPFRAGSPLAPPDERAGQHQVQVMPAAGLVSPAGSREFR